jgi:hypothetical protein
MTRMPGTFEYFRIELFGGSYSRLASLLLDYGVYDSSTG